MKSLIRILFFDKDRVNSLKRGNFSKSYFHNLLLEGKITLQEYLHLS